MDWLWIKRGGPNLAVYCPPPPPKKNPQAKKREVWDLLESKDAKEKH
jgi:hypothetical protein